MSLFLGLLSLACLAGIVIFAMLQLPGVDSVLAKGPYVGTAIGLLGFLCGIAAIIKNARHHIAGGKILSIIGIGSSLVTPLIFISLFMSTRLNLDRAPSCNENLGEISQAVLSYKADHNGEFPPELSALVQTKKIGSQAITCPVAKDKTQSYIYRSGDLKNLNNPDIIVLHDRQGNHSDNDMRYVLFADGTVDWLRNGQFQKAVEKDNQIRRDAGLPEKGPDGAVIPPSATPTQNPK